MGNIKHPRNKHVEIFESSCNIDLIGALPAQPFKSSLLPYHRWTMKTVVATVFSLFIVMPSATLAFVPQFDIAALRQQHETHLGSSRRDFVESVTTRATVLSTAALLLSVPVPNALASGGATAGGAYLLSAKQRYNERVKTGVKGFVGLQSDLEAGNLDPLRAYFSNEDAAGWKDFATAAYLLANAFRRNSTAAPDSLPSVKVSLYKRIGLYRLCSYEMYRLTHFDL